MNLRPNVGLTDVARAAGVSSSTASRALRREDRVSAETIARVQQAADELGYVPDKRAVNLRSHTPAALGLVLRSAELSFYGAIAARMQAAVDARGVDLLIANGGDDEVSQKRAIQNLLGHRVAGIVIASGRASEAAVEMAASSLPTVLVGASALHESVDSVSISADSEIEMAEAVLRAGHRRIAVTQSGVPGTAVLRARSDRYVETLRSGGAQVVLVTTSGGAVGSAVRAAVDDGATAIMAGDDLTALHIIEALYESGAAENVSVTGFDGVGVLRTPLLGLTTMEQPVHELAMTTIEVMLARLDGDEEAPQQRSLPGRFIAGRTLRTAATR